MVVSDDAVGSPKNRRFVRWLKEYAIAIILVFIALGYSGAVTIMHSNALSPIDEWVYSDYLDKVPAEVVVHQGEAIGPVALNRMACDGVYPYGGMGATCGASYGDISKFPLGGRTSADAYTPVYFVSTWVVGRVIRFLSPVDELTSWRLTSPLWLAGTLLLLFSLFRRHEVHPLVILTVGVAFIVSPFAWWTYTYVSTDAPSAFFGALLLLQATRLAQQPSRAWWLIATSVLGVIFKVTNILAVCLVALFLLLVWIQQILRSRREGTLSFSAAHLKETLRLPLVGAAAVALSVTVEVAWLMIRKVIAVAPQAGPLLDQPLAKRDLAVQLANFLPGTLTANVNVAGGGYALPVYAWAVAPLSWLCIAGVLGGFWSASFRSRRGPIMTATAIAAVGFAPMLAVVLTISQGAYIEIPPRYGASILSAMLFVVALTMRSRFVAWILLGYSVVLGIGMLGLTATLW